MKDTPITTRITWALGLVLVALALAACPGPGHQDALFVEDFERACEGTPCGWTQIVGSEDAAFYVETLPGDHGLQLVGDDVTVRGIPEQPTPPVLTTQLAVSAIARCDRGSLLDVRASFLTRSGAVETFEVELLPDSRWTGSLLDRSLRPVDSPVSAWDLADLIGISVRKSGEGSCELDYLSVRSVRFF